MNGTEKRIPVTICSIGKSPYNGEVKVLCDELYNKAMKLIENKYYFEAELLSNGVVFMDCCLEDDEIANEICTSSYEEMDKAFENLIDVSYKRIFNND